MEIYVYLSIYGVLVHSLQTCGYLAKQRIDSGFFLFQAEMKKKKDKKQSTKIRAKQCRNLKEFMDSSDEDFY